MPANYDAGTFEKCAADSGQVSSITCFRGLNLNIPNNYSPWVFTEAQHSSKETEPHLPLTLSRNPRHAPRPLL